MDVQEVVNNFSSKTEIRIYMLYILYVDNPARCVCMSVYSLGPLFLARGEPEV